MSSKYSRTPSPVMLSEPTNFRSPSRIMLSMVDGRIGHDPTNTSEFLLWALASPCFACRVRMKATNPLVAMRNLAISLGALHNRARKSRLRPYHRTAGYSEPTPFRITDASHCARFSTRSEAPPTLFQEHGVLTHGASLDAPPAEALVCRFETAAHSVSTHNRSKWPKRGTFLENRESGVASKEPSLRIPPETPLRATLSGVINESTKDSRKRCHRLSSS